MASTSTSCEFPSALVDRKRESSKVRDLSDWPVVSITEEVILWEKKRLCWETAEQNRAKAARKSSLNVGVRSSISTRLTRLKPDAQAPDRTRDGIQRPGRR